MITRENLWENEFGKSIIGYDFLGREVHRDAMQGKYCWNIDHILPESKNGKSDLSNLQITNNKSNSERENKTTFVIEGKIYQMQKASSTNIQNWANKYNYKNKKYSIVEIE